MNLTIRPEVPADFDAIRRVNRQAFGGEDEANLVDALRAGGHGCLSLIAEIDGVVVAHILFSHLAIIRESGPLAALALAPMGVLPGYQNKGVGTALIQTALTMCRERGHRIVIVLGHKEFYPRFGFSSALAAPLESVYAGESFMALELTPGALTNVTGRVVYAPPFNGL